MKYSIFFLISMLFLISCNLDVDTTDPQASRNIFQSKKNKLFLSEYELDTMDNPIFRIKEAWIEKSWNWEINYGFKEKVETGGYQLNLLLDSFIDSKIKNNEYVLNWRMKNEFNGYFMSTGDVYTLFIKQDIPPDTFNIIIEQINHDRTSKLFEHFTVKKKL